jgi:hypothetical protein
MAGNICDVCGKKDLPTFVCSSSLGAISFAYCEICHPMGAEPRGLIEGTIEMIGGIDKLNNHVSLTYYDQLSDSYIDKREGNIPIKLNDGTEIKTRSEMVKYLNQKGEI